MRLPVSKPAPSGNFFASHSEALGWVFGSPPDEDDPPVQL